MRLAAVLKTQSPCVEAAWRALTAARARSVAIVSAEGGEGVSLLASAIARRAVASSGRPALIVDLSDVAPPPLLTDEHREERDTPIIGDGPITVDDGIVRDLATRVGFLGRPDRSEATWREPTLLSARIDEWSAEWSFIVFDTAPLLTREADAVPPTSVAAACDACLMVALAGVTPANRILEAREGLDRAGAKLIGALLNDRENPALLAELERQTFRLQRFLPRRMAGMREWMRRSAVLGVTI